MADLAVLPIVVPLAGAIAVGIAPRAWQRAACLGVVALLIAIEIVLAFSVADGTVLVHRLGDWAPPYGIVLVADRLAATMLLLASGTALAVLWYDAAEPDPRLDGLPQSPLFLFLLMGLNGAFLTGDLFNLFVFFEVLLVSSYGLITLGGSVRQLRAGFQFAVLNLVSSALFLFGIGVLYGITGTLNLADLARAVPRLGPEDAVLLRVSMMSLLVVFSAKAALLPLAFWLPDSYPAPPAAISAMFGGIATKAGVYALLRVFTTAFAGVRDPAAEVLLTLGTVSMIVGVLGAVAQTEIRRLLSFHIVSQIGYLVFGIGLFSAAGLAATLFYLVHYTIVKCALFLVAGMAERTGGASELGSMRGLAHHSPALGVLFLVAGVSLAGLPPSSGFFSKFLLADAGLEAERHLGVTIAFVAGILTLFSMMKIWTMAFWGSVRDDIGAVPRRAQLAAAALLVSFSVTLPIGAEAMLRFTRATAAQVLDTGGYIVAVLGAQESPAAPAEES